MEKCKKEWLKIIESAPQANKIALIKSLCSNKKVLDVGCAGQDFKNGDTHWIHGNIHKVAKSLTGVDINDKEIEKLKKKGYSVISYHDLSSVNKYDVIVMADVIEHVDNPVDFIKDYAIYLNNDGIIIVTTPNSNKALNFITILLKNYYSVNEEHTMWLCPKTFLEIISRTKDLELKKFFWLNDTYRGDKPLKTLAILYIARLLAKFRANFSPSFVALLGKKQ